MGVNIACRVYLCYMLKLNLMMEVHNRIFDMHWLVLTSAKKIQKERKKNSISWRKVIHYGTFQIRVFCRYRKNQYHCHGDPDRGQRKVLPVSTNCNGFTQCIGCVCPTLKTSSTSSCTNNIHKIITIQSWLHISTSQHSWLCAALVGIYLVYPLETSFAFWSIFARLFHKFGRRQSRASTVFALATLGCRKSFEVEYADCDAGEVYKVYKGKTDLLHQDHKSYLTLPASSLSVTTGSSRLTKK